MWRFLGWTPYWWLTGITDDGRTKQVIYVVKMKLLRFVGWVVLEDFAQSNIDDEKGGLCCGFQVLDLSVGSE